MPPKLNRVPQSNREEMEVALAHAQEVLHTVDGTGERSASIRARTERIIQDINRKGLDNFRFFDTIPFYDRLRRVDRDLEGLPA